MGKVVKMRTLGDKKNNASTNVKIDRNVGLSGLTTREQLIVSLIREIPEELHPKATAYLTGMRDAARDMHAIKG